MSATEDQTATLQQLLAVSVSLSKDSGHKIVSKVTSENLGLGGLGPEDISYQSLLV